MTEHYDYLFKITLVGCTNVGKSSISKQFSGSEIDDDHFPTIGVNLLIRTIQLDELAIKLQCLDTGGCDRYPPITDLYYRLALGVIIVFDVTTSKSFNGVLFYIEKTKRLTKEDDTKIILVGNKCDLIEERKVSYESAKEFADSHSITYYEVSSKSPEQVEYVFVSLASMILKLQIQKQTEFISEQQDNQSVESSRRSSKCSVI